MIALLRYSIGEASLSLARGWRSGLLAIAIIAAAVFIAGAVLLVSINVDRILERLAATAELTIYLKPGDGEARRAQVANVSRGASERVVVELRRRATPPWRASGASCRSSPRWSAPWTRTRCRRPSTCGCARASPRRARAASCRRSKATGAVEDVRYDRRIFDRLSDGLRILRQGGLMLAAIIVLAAMVTITSVLRLAYLTRRDETAVLFLLGMPPSAIRGPFVVEGMLQTLAGALAAVLLLWAAFGAVNAQVGVGDRPGVRNRRGGVPAARPWWSALVVASMLVGALAGLVAAWKEP